MHFKNKFVYKYQRFVYLYKRNENSYFDEWTTILYILKK